MSGWERDDFIADVLKTFYFGCEEDGVGGRRDPSLIERGYADWISRRNNPISAVSYIVQYKTEEPVQLRSDIKIDLIVLLLVQERCESYQVQNNFTI